MRVSFVGTGNCPLGLLVFVPLLIAFTGYESRAFQIAPLEQATSADEFHVTDMDREHTIDVGGVEPGSTQEYVVPIVNKTTGRLVTSGISTSCGCVAKLRFPPMLTVGDRAKLQFAMTAPRTDGKFNRRITLHRDKASTSNEQCTLTVVGEVVSSLSLERDSIGFSDNTKVVMLANIKDSRHQWDDVRIEMLREFLQTQDITVSNKSISFTVSLKHPDSTPASIDEIVRFKASDGYAIEFPLHVDINQQVSTIPAIPTVYVRPGGVAEAKFYIKCGELDITANGANRWGSYDSLKLMAHKKSEPAVNGESLAIETKVLGDGQLLQVEVRGKFSLFDGATRMTLLANENERVVDFNFTMVVEEN